MHVDLPARQLRHAPVGRERHRHGLLVTLGQAHQGLLDLTEHHARTDQGGALLDALGRHALLARLRPGLQRHTIAHLGAALDHLEGAALHAQVVDHLVDVRVGHFRGMADDIELGDIDVAEVRHHLERGHEIQLAFALLLDARVAGQLKVLFAHGVVEGLAQQAVQGLGAHLVAVALLDDLGRHLAGTEPLDARGARQFAQAAADVGVQALSRQAEAHAALEVADRFDRNLHTH